MTTYGYARVSTKEQKLERQLDAFDEYDIKRKNIYVEKITGTTFKRPEYMKMMRRIKPGDLLVIMSIDRLGRNYSEILEQWRIITKERHVDVEVIDMPLLNTRQKENGLTGAFIADLVLQILAYVAETERAFIHKRQMEGIESAKKRGVHFGAQKIELGKEAESIYQLWMNREITLEEGAKILGTSVSTFYRRCQEYDMDFS